VNRLAQETLMQLYDGELPPDRARLVEQRLSGDAEWLGLFEGLEQVGDAVRALADRHVAVADTIADTVMDRIRAERLGAGARPPLHLVGAAAAQQPLSMFCARRPRSWRAPLALGAAAALAAAAALVIHVQPEPAEAPPHRQSSSAPFAYTVARPMARLEPGPGSELGDETELVNAVAIETVDFGSRPGTIFMVPSGGTATPVLWLTDESEPGGGRMQQL
jgi:negative regulator of sigma E activity